jgi:hypothetical protein
MAVTGEAGAADVDADAGGDGEDDNEAGGDADDGDAADDGDGGDEGDGDGDGGAGSAVETPKPANVSAVPQIETATIKDIRRTKTGYAGRSK